MEAPNPYEYITGFPYTLGTGVLLQGVDLAPHHPYQGDFARDAHSYMDDLPLFGMDEWDGDGEDALPPLDPQLAANHNDQAVRRWEGRFKLEIPKCHGNHNANEFLD